MFDRLLSVTVGMALAATLAGASDAPLRDPTRPGTHVPAVVTQKPAQRYVVSAIFFSRDRRVAIVNGRTVAPGDRVGGATVIDIASDRLTLAVGGKNLTARLATTRVRR